jgi:mannosyltransferase OCH1-like enzyme
MDSLVPAPAERIPRILHMVWLGDPPEYFWANAAKWRSLMPHWRIVLWTDAELASVPETVRAAVGRAHKGAQKADILRYWVVFEHGGVYVDADVTPHRSLDPVIALGAPVVVCHDLPVTWGYLINAFFAAAPGEPLLELASRRSLEAEYNTSDIHMKTGPRLFGECVEDLRAPCVLLPSAAFYHNECDELRYGTHLYAHTWR